MALPMHLYKDPLQILIERESRSCKGCTYFFTERVFGEEKRFCKKRKVPDRKCSNYREVE